MTLPGVAIADRARLNADARELVAAARARGARLDRHVLHVEPDAVTLPRRDELAALYRRSGVAALGKRLERAVVPPGALLVLVDVDGATHLTTAPIAALTGAADTASAALRIPPQDSR